MPEAALIKKILEKNRARYGTNLKIADAFERFTAETILKRYGLTYDQIESGIVDGKNDGGIDSLYMFVNRSLIATDTDIEVFKNPVEVDIYVVQSKIEAGFKESSIAKLITSIPHLMALDADSEELSVIYKNDVCAFFETYREKVVALADQFPKISIHIIYATLAKASNDKVTAMLPNLEKAVAKSYPGATCDATLWDAKKIYEEAQKQNVNVRKLRFEKSPVSHGKGYVLLAKLKDYYDFISHDGEIVDSLFEFNVRDYHRNATVNKEMGLTLADANDAADFWWLNNGITILAEEAAAQDSALTIRNPLVVNGLQTSHEIHKFFSTGGIDDKRTVQVRVLEIDDNALRDRVIKATNSQTGIKAASLHATEPFQRKIEEFLEQFGIFYDRRRDHWRNKGKPAESIIGIERLAQSIVSVLSERPSEARARPTSIMRDELTYKDLFDEDNDLNIYKTCANLYFLVDKYFRSNRETIGSVYRNNLRYYLMMSLAWRLNGSRPIHKSFLGKLNTSTLKESDINEEMNHLIKVFDKAGANDRTAKDLAFVKTVKKKSKVPVSSLAAK